MDLTPEELAFLASVFDAVRDGSTDAVARVLDQGLPANLTNDQGDTLLILAAYYNHPELVELLLGHGAEPDRVNDRGQTALGAATFRQNERSVRALLAAGADPRRGGRSALVLADYFGLTAMKRLLVDHAS